MNFASMLQKAQQIRKKVQDAQKDLAQTDIKGEAANGAVSVVCDGNSKFKSIKLSAEQLNIDSETAETLEDLITVAMQQAMSEANKRMQDKMKGIIPADLNIPGLI